MIIGTFHVKWPLPVTWRLFLVGRCLNGFMMGLQLYILSCILYSFSGHLYDIFILYSFG